jgi:16S rRNA (uracil1498-N3)-methyltransferase
MAVHRFYINGQLNEFPGDELTIGGEPAHRISIVLRMRPGERLALFDGSRELECELIELRPRVRVRVLEELTDAVQPRRLTLFQGLIRPNRFEWLIEKVTEIGVAAIVPVITAQAAVRPQSIGAGRFDRWRRILVEASEQSGRRFPPALHDPIDLAGAIQSAPRPAVFAWEGMRSQPVSAIEVTGSEMSLFIGPEGGWSDDEVNLARESGLAFLNLGPNILRSETAAIVATAFILTA